MILFIPSNTFWRVEKLDGFGKKFLGTLGDALGSFSPNIYGGQFINL
jgi:hypothetical protein